MDCRGGHRLGERCFCGHLTIPARFYWYEDSLSAMLTEERSQEEAECAYLSWADKNGVLVKGVTRDVTQGVTVTRLVTRCQDCGKTFGGRGSRCGACRMKRSRSHA